MARHEPRKHKLCCGSCGVAMGQGGWDRSFPLSLRLAGRIKQQAQVQPGLGGRGEPGSRQISTRKLQTNLPLFLYVWEKAAS